MYTVLRRAKTIEYVVCIIFFVILTGILLAYPQDVYISILGFTMSCGFIINSVYQLFWGQCSHKVVFNDEGVEYHTKKETYSMKWDEVEYIAVWKNEHGPINSYSMISFEKYIFEKYDVSRREHHIRKVKSYDESFFGVQYRKEIVEEVKKHWTELIPGLNAIEG